MMGFSNLLLFFALYSFMGWLLETIFASVRERKFINRGFLDGFFCPIYGFGAILIIQSSLLITMLVKNNFSALVISVVFSVILITALEYVTGYVLEKLFSCKCWDYSDNAANVHGYICLKYSLLWGLLAFLLVRVAHPALSAVISLIPASLKMSIVFSLLLYFLADTANSVVDALNLREFILNHSNFSVSKYREKVIQYKRFFLTFPRLLISNAGGLNRDIRIGLNITSRFSKSKASEMHCFLKSIWEVIFERSPRSILNEKIDKIKVELKSRFQ